MCKFKKIIAIMLSVIIFTTMLFGCNGKTVDEAFTPPPSNLADTNIELKDYIIVVPKNASATEIYSAEELAKYFLMALGNAPNIETDEGKSFSDKSKYISVGKTSILSGSGLTLDRNEFNVDGYKIKRFKNTVIISGYVERGTLYGVYKFLYYQFGFTAYASDEIKINKSNDTVMLKDFDIVDRPSFQGRDMDGPMRYAGSEFVAMSRMKTTATSEEYSDAKYGGGLWDEWHGSPYEGIRRILPLGTYNDPLKTETYNPGWYEFSSKQFCLTYGDRNNGNDTLLDEYVEQWKKRILQYPLGVNINIGEEDMGGYCNCNTCSTQRDAYTQVGLFIRFANKVIERIESWKAETPEVKDRDFRYMIFAYNDTLPAPLDAQKQPLDPSVIPNEKLYIRFTPIMYCMYHGVFDEACSQNTKFRKAFNDWQILTDRFMIWDYDACYHNYYPFIDNYGHLQNTYINYYEAGVTEYMRESTTGSAIRSLGDMGAYINSQLMWNVYADVPVMIDDFINNYYKSGAPYMREYFELMRTHLAATEKKFIAEDKPFHIDMYSGSEYYFSPQVWSKRLLEQMMDLLDKADASYESIEDKVLAEKLKDRIAKERICVRYTILRNYSSYYNIASTKYIDEINSFEQDVIKFSAYMYRESGNTLEWIKTLRSKGG